MIYFLVFQSIHDLISNMVWIHDVCLQFDLRNSALRRKYDGLKYTLKKLEVNPFC